MTRTLKPFRRMGIWIVFCAMPSSRDFDPITAIQMMTINTAEHFGVAKEMGMIAPGRWADVVLVKDLNRFKADLVIARGQVIAEGGKWKVTLPKFRYPSWAMNSVYLKRPLKAEDFRLQVKGVALSSSKGQRSKVKANVIGVIENQAPTRHLTFDVQPENGEIKVDMSRDIAKIALVERHKGTGAITMGTRQRVWVPFEVCSRFHSGA